MIDTVHLWYPFEDERKYKDELPSCLTDIQAHIKQDGMIYKSASLKNLRLFIGASGISIKGSLCKYQLGNNLNSIMRQDVQRAVESLSDDIQLPIHRAKVTRIDIGENFTVNFLPEIYFPYFGVCRYFNRLIQPHCLYYTNMQKTKAFYNKKIEAKKRGEEMPGTWEEREVLRYELRFCRKLPQQFSLGAITAKILHEENFYMGLLKKYVSQYDQIRKIGPLKVDFTKVKTPKDFLNLLLCLKISEMGQDKVFQIVDELRAKKVFTSRMYYTRLKTEINKLLLRAGENSNFQNEMVNDLTKKIHAIKRYYR